MLTVSKASEWIAILVFWLASWSSLFHNTHKQCFKPHLPDPHTISELTVCNIYLTLESETTYYSSAGQVCAYRNIPLRCSSPNRIFPSFSSCVSRSYTSCYGSRCAGARCRDSPESTSLSRLQGTALLQVCRPTANTQHTFRLEIILRQDSIRRTGLHIR